MKTPKRISAGYLNAMGSPFIEVGKSHIEIGGKNGRFCLYLCNIGLTTLQTPDVVTIHCILTSETENLVGAAELKKMKKTAFLIDVSRGAIIEEKALFTALQENWIAGAGLDVFSEEPLLPGHPLLALENVILTPHLAWYTKEATEGLDQETLQQTLEILEGKTPQNIKNPEVLKTLNTG